MSKIALISRDMRPGGTQKAVLALMYFLLEKGNDVTLYLQNNEGDWLEKVPANVKIKEMVFTKNRYRFWVEVSLPKWEKYLRKKMNAIFCLKKCLTKRGIHEFLLKHCKKVEESYDAVLEVFGWGFFTTPFAAEMIPARKRALWFHGENVRWAQNVERYLNRFDAFYCVSESVKHKLEAFRPKYSERCKVLHNFIDINEIREKAEKAPEKDDCGQVCNGLRIVSVARLAHEKRIDIAIEAAAVLKLHGVDFHWFFIGNGPLSEELQKLIKQKGLESCVTLLGFRANPYPYMKECDIFVQTSQEEGYSISILEAKVLGCPIVATDIAANAEQITNGENGWLVPLSADAFAAKLEELARNPQERQRLRESVTKENINFSKDYWVLEELFAESP